jgi:2'-5' RNA ligase
MTQATSQCATCERFTSTFARGHGPDGTYSLPSNCAAYPDGIPEEIYQNLLDHRDPLPGDHGLQWVTNGLAFPVYAMATPARDTAPVTSPLTAAAELGDAQTGAMVALIPSAPDAQRLALPLGIGELHCTIAYLGLAEELGNEIRVELLEWAADAAGASDPVPVEILGPAVFNPSTEPCIVMLLGGADLAEFFEIAVSEISDIVDLPEQHRPWHAHVTLAYIAPEQAAPDLGAKSLFAERTGPATFDVLRVAFAGEIHDFPLGGTVPATVESDDATAVDPGKAPAVASSTPQRVRFDGCPYCEVMAIPGEPLIHAKTCPRKI